MLGSLTPCTLNGLPRHGIQEQSQSQSGPNPARRLEKMASTDIKALRSLCQHISPSKPRFRKRFNSDKSGGSIAIALKTEKAKVGPFEPSSGTVISLVTCVVMADIAAGHIDLPMNLHVCAWRLPCTRALPMDLLRPKKSGEKKNALQPNYS